MNTITSHQNQKLKNLRSLHNKKGREKAGLFIVEGTRAVKEALEYPDRVVEIFVTPEIKDEIELPKDNVYIINQELMDSVSQTVTPQGILATIKSNLKPIDSVEGGKYIYLDRLQDPGNLGGIIRGVDAFGLDGIIIGPGTVDPTNDKVARSTVASIMRVSIYISKGLEDLKKLSKSYTLYGTDLDKDSTPIRDTIISGNSIVVIGNEGEGVSQEVLQIVDHKIHIPMPGSAESLNANVAASIIMYEMNR